MKPSKRAFTLIELLVVIAIIAILAAILFPVFAQAKLSAKKAADLSNIKQVTLGTLLYSSDYDDMMPVYSFGLDSPRENFLVSYIWSSALCIGPYLKSVDILKSPDDNYTLGDSGDYPAARVRWSQISYMPNTVNPSVASYFPNNSAPQGAISPGPMMDSMYGTTTGATSNSMASNPADLMFLAPGRADFERCMAWTSDYTNQEIQWYPYWTVGIGGWGWDIQALTVTPWDGNCEKAWRRYNGSANFSFFDGHAKTMRPGELMDGNFPREKRWLLNAAN
ncbi:MAG: prepilin-type N-terminal cleavage/methylation domain-containing protein [Fimbriimonadaceae bacterium]|nr:prepilin-type N-terminal cleavage/methylation domain-containing protein [Fimbriimonadaceae bacterium]